MRKDSSQYIINVNWDSDRYEFKATFASYHVLIENDCTYGTGNSKGDAVLNLIENARKWELEE